MYKINKKDLHWRLRLTKESIMKISLTALICSVGCMHISASTMAQNVSMKHTKISLKDAFKEINKQTGYHYLWSAQKVKSNTTVTVDIKNQPLEKAIQSVIGGLQLGYELDGNLIIIKERHAPAVREIQAPIIVKDELAGQQTIVVRGRVVDSLNNGLAGVTVSVLQANGKMLKQASTGANGEVLVENVAADSYLEFSLMGYQHKRIKAVENIGTIRLKVQTTDLEELVVVGYTKKSASEVTGSVQAISGNELRSSVSSPNVLSMLKGRTTGLYITEGSGEAGAKGEVVERGQSSLATPTNSYFGPLIVVDGVITNYKSLQDAVNPSDIENVSILKDASSTAIYGSRAAQGVIVVTTKRGAAGQSSADVTVQYGITQPRRNIRFMNSTELIGFMDKQMQRYWEQTPSVQTAYPNVADFIAQGRTYSDEDRDRNFNWEDAIYSTGNFRNTDVSIHHGTEKTKFYAGVNWYKENGILYKNSFDRKSIRVNIDHKISSKLQASINLSSMVDLLSRRNGVPELYMVQPFMDPYDATGKLRDSLQVNASFNYGPAYPQWTQNFLSEAKYDNNSLTKVQSHLGMVRLRYQILPYLSLQSSNSINYIGNNFNSYLDVRSFSGKYGGYPYLFYPGMTLPNGTLDINDFKYVDYLTSNTLNFNKQFGKHNISALLGQEWGKRTTETMTVNMYDILPGERNMGAGKYFGDVFTAAFGEPYSPRGNYQERATFSVFGQADYNYTRRYLASASVRTDATTNFGRDKRYGTFYAFSAGWMMSSEDFMKDVKAVNNLKLRAAYGTSGRDLGDGYLNTTFYANTYDGSTGIRYEQPNNVGTRISQLANPNISWETLHNTNLGLDASFFQRIDLTFDWYHKRSDGLLQNVVLSSAQGAMNQYRNVGQIVNKGVEIMLNTHNIKSQDFNWHTSFNISFNKNEITKLYQDSLIESSGQAYYRKIGEDINVIKAIRFAGINSENGNIQHYNFDANGNQIIVDGLGETSKLANYQVVGSLTPKFFGGFNNTFQYKNLTLNASWWFQYGNYVAMSLIKDFQSPTMPRDGYNNVAFGDNQHVWTGPGDTKANYPDVFSIDPNAWSSLTTRSSKLWGDASHARLRNVRLTYSLSQQLLQKMKLAKADIYVSGDNLWVIRKKDFVGADPEGARVGTTQYSGVSTGFANPRRFLIGVQLTF